MIRRYNPLKGKVEFEMEIGEFLRVQQELSSRGMDTAIRTYTIDFAQQSGSMIQGIQAFRRVAQSVLSDLERGRPTGGWIDQEAGLRARSGKLVTHGWDSFGSKTTCCSQPLENISYPDQITERAAAVDCPVEKYIKTEEN